MRTKIRILLISQFLFFTSVAAFAVPALRIVKTVTQPDGSKLEIRLGGDEFFRYYQTTDGVPVKEIGGCYYYARLTPDSLEACLDYPAREEEFRPIKEQAFASRLRTDFSDGWLNTRASRMRYAPIRRAEVAVAPYSENRQFGSQQMPPKLEGKKKGLVILVNFKDIKMQVANPKETFMNLMNTEGYKEHGQYGSVRDYFFEQSYGKFEFQFDVVGPVELPQTMAYYGENVKGFDGRADEMVLDACLAADSEVDFSDYDWNHTGKAEQIFVIYAGYAESNGADSKTVWPHQSYVYTRDGRNLVLDGTIVKKYACSSELNGLEGVVLNGIGTICHEFSHCFGLPDFYDTSGGDAWGMNRWSLMDYGSYNDSGNTPIGYTAYERMMCGWLEPIVLDTPQAVRNMPALSDEPVAYAILNDANADEYYLLENRQLKGFDSKMYAHGMMVVHVDYDARAWTYNTVNINKKRQRVSIIPADNHYGQWNDMASYASDLFPGLRGVRELTDTSVPKALLHTPNSKGVNLMSKPIYNISESNGLISFDFMNGGSTDIVATESESVNKSMCRVYRYDGSLVGVFPVESVGKTLPAGVYILHSGNKTKKIVVR